MNRPPHLSPEESIRIVTLAEEGLSVRQIALRINAHYSTVSRCIKRYRETGRHTRRPTGGRPRATSAMDERFLRVQALRRRESTNPELQQLILEVRNLWISRRTVGRRLNEAGLTSRRPATGPQLTREHRVARLAFAREHANWTADDWKRVFFTDETRVSLHSPDGRGRVWRRPRERFSQCCISPRVAFGGGSLMFWGGISWGARTELVVVRCGALTGPRYVEEILQEHVLAFMHFIGPDALLMHDNATPHTARCVTDYLDYAEIERLQWPAKSPDLNCLEHMWDALKRRVRVRNPAPTTLAELETAVLEEWEQFPQEAIQDLIRSMPRRMEAVIRARGGNTAY